MVITWLADISNYQAGFDVGRAVREGYAGIIMKASEGTTFKDRQFDTFAGQVLAAGAVPGAYHYLREEDGAGQAEMFHARIAAWGGPAGWICACDNEADAEWETTSSFYARWSQLTGGHPLMMYSSGWWWPSGWDGTVLTPYLWDSRYVSGSDTGSGLYAGVPESWWTPRYGRWPVATMLQFTSSALVAGRKIDVSAFRGTVDDLKGMLTRSGGATVSRADELVEAWDGGFETTASGGHCELTVRQKRADDFMVAARESLARLEAAPGGVVVLDEASRAAIVAAVADDVVSRISPALRGVTQMMDRLGAAGDALGVLNDPGPEVTG